MSGNGYFSSAGRRAARAGHGPPSAAKERSGHGSGAGKDRPAAKRSLGQNFLLDQNIARKIVGLLRITAEDSVMEIGPGSGALTRFIAECNPARLLVVEKDAYWAEAAARLLAEHDPQSAAAKVACRAGEAPESFRDSVPNPVAEAKGACRAGEAPPRVAEHAPPATEAEIFRAGAGRPAAGDRLCVMQADALTLPFERFAPGWKIIGNLPYNIASPLLWELFSRMPAPARAVFMLQKEVGLRLTAVPGSRAYGALSVWLQSFTRPRAAFVVPPHVFHPRPKVDSLVLLFEPHVPRPPDEKDDARSRTPTNPSCVPARRSRPPAGLSCSPADLAHVLHACFRMRRKQMGNIAASCGVAPQALEALGLDPRSRPENLTPEDFRRLAAARLFRRALGHNAIERHQPCDFSKGC